MFDIGFLELCLLGIVALLVLGPERLPVAARTLGLWLGKAKRSFNSIKNEIDRELKLEEVRAQIKEQQNAIEQQVGLDELNDTANEVNNTIHQLNQPVDMSDVEKKSAADSPDVPDIESTETPTIENQSADKS